MSTQETHYDSVRLADVGLLLRFNKPDEKFAPIFREYTGIGYPNKNGTLNRRSVNAQLDLAERCMDMGVCVPKPIGYLERDRFIPYWGNELPSAEIIARMQKESASRNQTYAALFPYINGVPLSEVLHTPSVSKNARERKYYAIQRQLADMQTVHARDVVIGDRWGPNQIVTQENNTTPVSLAHIDLDLDITKDRRTGRFNPWSREFEAAQILYHLGFWTSSKERQSVISEAIAPAWNLIKNSYTPNILRDLLVGHKRFFEKFDRQYAYKESGQLIDEVI